MYRTASVRGASGTRGVAGTRGAAVPLVAVVLSMAMGAPATAQPRGDDPVPVSASLRGSPRPGRESTIVVAAGERYRAGSLHRWILGAHHRELWTRPVRVPFLDLDREAGGLTPLRAGGGMQTRSLRLEGADGREYVFRSVDKDPSAVLDPLLRGTVVDDLVQDGISAAHPYGALVVAPLLEAARILHAEPRLRVMPDDPALGELRNEFGGMLGLFEERPDENHGGATSFAGAKRVIGSEKLTERLEEGPDDRVDARAYLKARLLDVLVGDWDRHRGQWRWVTFDVEAPRRWLPVPRDRDQAFSRFDGVATRLVSLHVPQLVRFGSEYPSMARLHWNARALDRWFLAGLDRDVWREVGAELRDALTDEVIGNAVRRLPPEIHQLSGAPLESALRARRDALPEALDELYETMSRVVEVRATDADETVVVDRSAPGSLTVSLAAPDESPYFHRTFRARETREVRIYLRGGDDEVLVRGDADPGMIVRLVGGPDDDRYDVRGRGDGIHVYDHEGTDEITGADAPGIDDRPFDEWEWSPENRNQPLDWGHRTLPVFWSSFSSDHGLFVGGGARVERYGFRQRPYASAFDLRAGYAPSVGEGRAQVSARFNRPSSPLFWTAHARVSGLDVLHFYGLGNATAPGSPSHHRVRLTRVSAAAGAGVAPAPWMELTGTVEIERSDTRDGGGSYLSTLGPIYGSGGFTTLGVGGRLTFDPLRESRRVGHRFRLTLEGMAHPAVLDATSGFGRAGGALSALIASSPWPALSLALRAEALQVFGRFPWHHAAFLGGRESVRGWDEQRFAGDASVLAGAELRVRAWRPRIVLPAILGVFGFADTGRVWLDGDSAGGWHTGVGGGLYLQPAGQPYLARLGTATSAEATKLFLTVGLPY